MNRIFKKIFIPISLLTLLLFSSSALAANCFLYKKDTYKTKPDGTKCWYQDFRTGSTPAAPAGYLRLSSAGLKPGQNCGAFFTAYAKGQVTTNSWSCVKGTLNGAVVGTKGTP